jgi:hypothetical protein
MHTAQGKFKNRQKEKPLDKFRNAAMPNCEPSQAVLESRQYKTAGQSEMMC